MTKSQAKSGKTLLHWSQRQQQQQEQHQQQQQQLQHAQQLLSDKAAINDTLDVLEACGSHPQQSEWRRLWELASSRYFDRQHRVLWWRILHGSLMCGAYKAYIHRATPEQACCPFFFFFFFFLGGMDIHYTSATIATPRLCEVHHKPKRPRLTTHSESVQA